MRHQKPFNKRYPPIQGMVQNGQSGFQFVCSCMAIINCHDKMTHRILCLRSTMLSFSEEFRDMLIYRPSLWKQIISGPSHHIFPSCQRLMQQFKDVGSMIVHQAEIEIIVEDISRTQTHQYSYVRFIGTLNNSTLYPLICIWYIWSSSNKMGEASILFNLKPDSYATEGSNFTPCFKPNFPRTSLLNCHLQIHV